MAGVKSLVGQTAIYGLPTIVGRLLNYLLVPLYTRLFLPEEYGVVTELYAYVAFLMVLVTYGMETAFFRFSKKYSGDPKVFSTAAIALLCSSVFFFVAVYGGRVAIARWIGYADHPEYIVCFAAILALDAVSVIPFASLRDRHKPLRFALLKTLNIAANITFNLFFIVFCPYWLSIHPQSVLQAIYQPSIGVGYIFLSNLLATSLTALFLLPDVFCMKWVFRRALAREMLLYAFPVMVWGMAGIVNETFDRILLKHLLADPSEAMAQLGIYGACYKVSILMTLFIQAFRFAAEPFFFQQSDQKDAPLTYAKVMRYFVLFGLFIFLCCVLFLDDIMLFVGKDFREGVVVVPILLMANLFLGIFYNLSVWYKVTDKTRIGAYIATVGAVITVGLNWVLVPLWGYVGAAWATLACYVVIAVLSYLLGQKNYPVPYPLKALSLYFLLALSLYGFFLLLSPEWGSWNRLFAALFLAVYLGIVYRNERKYLWK